MLLLMSRLHGSSPQMGLRLELDLSWRRRLSPEYGEIGANKYFSTLLDRLNEPSIDATQQSYSSVP